MENVLWEFMDKILTQNTTLSPLSLEFNFINLGKDVPSTSYKGKHEFIGITSSEQLKQKGSLL